MSVDVNVNGVSFAYPTLNDSNWGDVASSWAVQVSNTTLQLNAGDFSITNELNLGPNFGLKALQLETRSSNPALAGFLRLSNSDLISWRNNANDANLSLSISASDRLSFEGAEFVTAGSTDALTNKTIDADLNTLSNIRTSNFASGVIKTDFTSTDDSSLPTSLAVETEISSQITTRLATERDATVTLMNKTLTSPVINGGTVDVATISTPTITTPAITDGTISGTAISNTAISNFQLSGTVPNTIITTAGDFTLPADLPYTSSFTFADTQSYDVIFSSLPEGWSGTIDFENQSSNIDEVTLVFKDVVVLSETSNTTVDRTRILQPFETISIRVHARRFIEFLDPLAEYILETAPTTQPAFGTPSVQQNFTWICPMEVNEIVLQIAGAGASGRNTSTIGGGAAAVVSRRVAVNPGRTYNIAIGLGPESNVNIQGANNGQDGMASTFSGEGNFATIDGRRDIVISAGGGSGTNPGVASYIGRNSFAGTLEVLAGSSDGVNRQICKRRSVR